MIPETNLYFKFQKEQYLKIGGQANCSSKLQLTNPVTTSNSHFTLKPAKQ